MAIVNVGDFIERRDSNEFGVVVEIDPASHTYVAAFRMRPGYCHMDGNPDFYLTRWSIKSFVKKPPHVKVLPCDSMVI